MEIFLLIVGWYLIGLLGSVITLWAYFYEEYISIDTEDVILGFIMALLGPFNLLISVFYIIRWIFFTKLKLNKLIPEIHIQKKENDRT